MATQASVRSVALQDIRFDHAYQRDANSKRVEYIATHWNPQLAGIVILSNRAGALWCVDGQHRLMARAQRGETHADSEILEGLTQQGEAELFVLYNGSAKHLTGWDKFKAQLVAQDPEAVGIEAAVLATGYRLGNNPAEGWIVALAACRRVYAQGGKDHLMRVLQTIRAIWQHDRRATSAGIIHGLGSFLYAYQSDPKFRFDRLSQVLEATPPIRFLRRANEIRYERMTKSVSAFAVADAIREQYNAGLGRESQLGVLTPTAIRTPQTGKPHPHRGNATKKVSQ